MKILKRISKIREISSVIFLVIIFLIVGMINPMFLQTKNILLILNGSIVFLLLAMGIAFVIINGEIDVSIGATLGLSAAISSTILREGGSWQMVIISALAVGIVVGLLNGVGITVFKVPSIIMTLGTNLYVLFHYL